MGYKQATDVITKPGAKGTDKGAKVSLEEWEFSTNPWSAHHEGEMWACDQSGQRGLLLFRMQRLHVGEGQLQTLPGLTSTAPTPGRTRSVSHICPPMAKGQGQG